MDWKIFFAAFSAIFVAELADKTQLVGLGMSAQSGKPISVLLGSIAAYAVVTLITVMLGSIAGKYIKPEVVKYIGGVLFIGLGALMLMGKI